MSKQTANCPGDGSGPKQAHDGTCNVLDIALFEDYIKNCCGLSFDETRVATLECGILARISALGLLSPADYFNVLTHDRREFDNLVSLLTVNETYFFREPVHLQILTDRLVPSLLASKKPNEKIRIMSAGCSSGEEPYSIVMALMEKFGDSAPGLFSVIGVDIDSGAFSSAKQALYSRHSFRNFPDILKNRYFDTVDSDFATLKKNVREQVDFKLLNLLSESYPDALKHLDVIFYRNVSIYFEPEVQRRIFSKLAELLNDEGYLFVSSTETLAHDMGIMSQVEIDNQFLYCKKPAFDIGNRRTGISDRREVPRVATDAEALRRAGRRPAVMGGAADQSAVGPSAGKLRERAPVSDRREPSTLFDEALALANAKHYRDAVKLAGELIKQKPSFIKAYTLKASLLINLKELDEAERLCLGCIEREPWCLEAFLLLGLIEKSRNNEEAAYKRFKESLYIKSSCWLAHFYIAEMHRMWGEPERACREYEIVINLLKKGDIRDHGISFFPLSFPVEQIMHLCDHNLAQLKRKRN